MKYIIFTVLISLCTLARAEEDQDWVSQAEACWAKFDHFRPYLDRAGTGRMDNVQWQAIHQDAQCKDIMRKAYASMKKQRELSCSGYREKGVTTCTIVPVAAKK